MRFRNLEEVCRTKWILLQWGRLMLRPLMMAVPHWQQTARVRFSRTERRQVSNESCVDTIHAHRIFPALRLHIDAVEPQYFLINHAIHATDARTAEMLRCIGLSPP